MKIHLQQDYNQIIRKGKLHISSQKECVNRYTEAMALKESKVFKD